MEDVWGGVRGVYMCLFNHIFHQVYSGFKVGELVTTELSKANLEDLEGRMFRPMGWGDADAYEVKVVLRKAVAAEPAWSSKA